MLVCVGLLVVSWRICGLNFYITLVTWFGNISDWLAQTGVVLMFADWNLELLTLWHFMISQTIVAQIAPLNYF